MMDIAQIDKRLDGFVRYLTVLDGLAQTSVAVYRRLVNEFFAWLSGNDDLRPVGQLTHKDVEGYLEWCYYRGNGNYTRHTKLTALRRYFRFLRYEGIIPDDITRDIPKPRIKKKFIQKFTQEEHIAFFRAIDPGSEKGLRDIVILILAGFCGLRVGEIAQLRLEHIQDDGKLIDVQIPDDIAKQGGHGSAGRTVDLWALPSRDVRRYVDIRLRHGAGPEDPLLVTYRLKRPGILPLNGSMLDSVLKFYAARAGIRKAKVTMHMFRATHANDCRHVDRYDTRAIQYRLGHASMATTDRYLPDHRRINKTYPSFAALYRWYEKVWENKSKEEK
jgi:site-specific recombinase XerD